MFTINGKYTTAKVMIDDVEESCVSQIHHFTNHLAFTNPVAIMPDCLSIDTEILTNRGFKRISNLLKSDLIACVDIENDRKVLFEKPQKIIVRDKKENEKIFSIEFNRFKNERIITENHRVAYKEKPGILAHELPDKMFIKDFLWNGAGLHFAEPLPKGFCLDDILFSAWITGDGSIKRTKNAKSINERIRFGFKKQRKINRIIELCKKLGIHPKVIHSTKQTEIYINTKDSKKYINFLPNKILPFNTICSLSKESASILIKEFIKIDGDWENYVKTGRMRVNSSLKENLDFISALVSINYGTSGINDRTRQTSYGKVKMYYTDITKERDLYKSRSGLHNTPVYKKRTTYNDKVCCITCSTGFFIARRLNRTFITGNCHQGKSSVIGFSMEMTDKIIPNVIGVDIGCGVKSIKIGKFLNISLEELDRKIRESTPFGTDIHDNALINMKKEFPWRKINVQAEKFAMAYLNKFGSRITPPNYNIDWFLKKSKQIGVNLKRAINSIGTLGQGNHFYEMGISNNKDYWATVHSGSRNFGKCICEYWQNKAIKILNEDKRNLLQEKITQIREKYKKNPRQIKEEIKKVRDKLGLNYGINMKGCEWLEDTDATEYLFDMIFSQMYAEINREYMIRAIEKIIKTERTDEIETTHNFIDFRDFIIRKGAIRSYKNERMVIPFNMRDGILICEGKSNEEWNYSAPHGAGRIMSRSKANKTINLNEFKNQMKGIYSTSINENTKDEAPGVYKDSDIIEKAIGPTATIIDKIKPVLNMKSGGMTFRKKGKK